jgi:U3 small nucleolar RNA-associated protein 4
VAYVRSFPRIDARLLCTAWHPNRTTVVVGSSDGCLRCWDSRTTTELLRITLGHGAGPRATPCVWAVAVLPDGTLVSGDSEGVTSLWDAEHGTLQQAFKAHEADVLALACSPSGDAVFAAGVDSKVAMLARVSPAAADDDDDAADAALPPMASWSLVGYKRAHTHDVRALALAPFPPADANDGGDSGRAAHLGSMLLSAGTDAQLLAYAAENFLGEHPVRVVRVPPSPALSLAAQAPAAVLSGRPLLLCTHATWLDIWQLGTTADRSAADAPPVRPLIPFGRARCAGAEVVTAHVTDVCAPFSPTRFFLPRQVNGSALELASAPAHLARIRVRCQRHLLCSAIAGDGSYVAAADALATHLFALSKPAGKRMRVAKRRLAADVPAAQHMVRARCFRGRL